MGVWEQRHKLGWISTLRMLRATHEIAPEYRSLQIYDVDLKWHNIMDWKSLGTYNSIAFCFDKAFPCALLLHVLFQIINSTKIRLFISCKEFFSKGRHRCVVHWCEFKYGDLMRYLAKYSLTLCSRLRKKTMPSEPNLLKAGTTITTRAYIYNIYIHTNSRESKIERKIVYHTLLCHNRRNRIK